MTILITGGSGFLGQAFLSHILKETKEEVYTLSRNPFDFPFHRECDLLDLNRTKKVLQEIEPSLVIHTAANPNTRPNENNPSQIIRDNIETTNNLIYNLKNCPNVLFISSATVYGYYNKLYPNNYNSRTRPISLYATTKLACEGIINSYTNQGRIKGKSIRIPALVGINATHGLLKDLITKLESSSPTLDLIGNAPGTIKPFCLVNEIAELCYQLATEDMYEIGLVSLVGNDDSISVEEIAKIVMQELGIYKQITWSGQTWPGDNLEMYIEPCFKPRSNSKESITKLIKEYRKLKNEKRITHV